MHRNKANLRNDKQPTRRTTLPTCMLLSCRLGLLVHEPYNKILIQIRFLDVLLHAIIKFHRQRYVFAVLWCWISMVWCWSNRKLKSNPFSTLLVLICRPMTRICVNYIDNDLFRLNDCHLHVYYINPEVKSMQSKIEYSMVVFLFTALETKS